MTSTGKSLERIDRLRRALGEADAVIVGAGAGLSAAAGFAYSGKRFEAHFADFIRQYGFSDMYTGGFYPFASPEEHWAYWSRYIWINRYMDAPKPVYRQLLRLVQNTDYFVITTNVDHCFQKAGFDKMRLFCTQGDYGLWQCSLPCHQKTYDNYAAVRRMLDEQTERKIPSELIPRCPVCGAPMSMNLRSDDTFVEDEGWHNAAERYAAFIGRHKHTRVLYLEPGVGSNTPGIIKYPFRVLTSQNPQAVYACLNREEAFAPQEIAARSICIDADIAEVLSQLTDTKDSGLSER